jgi:hypothetical protein
MVQDHGPDYIREMTLLHQLLYSPTSRRSAPDYEAMFDEFVATAGGGKAADCFQVPPKLKNADYYFDLGEIELLLELKQITKYELGKTTNAYFEELYRRGRILSHMRLSETQIRIDADSLTQQDWRRFYKGFRPNITTHLDKAASQLKDTLKLLSPEKNRRHMCGVVLLNTGDYNLPLDLMHRLVEWRVKDKWHRGLYSKLDFVICLSVDMVKDGQHPLQGRGIVRDIQDDALVGVMRNIYDKWLRYYAASIDAVVEFDPNGTIDAHTQLSGENLGKVRFSDQTSTAGEE